MFWVLVSEEFRKRTQIGSHHSVRREFILLRGHRRFSVFTFDRMERRYRISPRRRDAGVGRDVRQTKIKRDEREISENDQRQLRR